MAQAKATNISQDADTFHGFAAIIHFNDDAVIDNLIEMGYEFDCPEASDQNGYKESMWVFGNSAGTKAEWMKELRKDIKKAC